MTDSILIDLVHRLGGLLRARQRMAGSKENLLSVHQDVLQYLSSCNRYSNTPVAVSEYLLITKGTASQTIRVLERRGLLRKLPDTKDGRSVRLSLTAKGRRTAGSLGNDNVWKPLLDAIHGNDLLVAEQTLTQLLRGLQRDNNSKTFGQCRTCHHLQSSGRNQFLCGLTQEPLTHEETLQICHEHQPVSFPDEAACQKN